MIYVDRDLVRRVDRSFSLLASFAFLPSLPALLPFFLRCFGMLSGRDG